jgi:hypothetical protein
MVSHVIPHCKNNTTLANKPLGLFWGFISGLKRDDLNVRPRLPMSLDMTGRLMTEKLPLEHVNSPFKTRY